MGRDLRLLAWLRWRHARGRLTYWAALASADIESGGLVDRAYLVYMVAILAVWAVLMMAAAASGARDVGAAAGSTVVDGLSVLARVATALLAGFLGVRAARSSPVKLTHPDIAYVGSSSLDTRAIALAHCARELGPVALLAVPVGYLLGSVAVGAGSPGVAAAETAGALSGAASLVLVCAWALGNLRTRVAARGQARPGGSSLQNAGYIAVAVFAAAASALWPGQTLAHALGGGAGTLEFAALAGALVGAVAVLAVAAARMDMTRVMGESVLYADLQVMRPLQMYDPAAYAEIVRRKRLAMRMPRWHLGGGTGGGVLVARALLAHVRQPSTLATPILWGAAVLPFVAAGVLYPHGFIAAMPPAFIFIAAPSRQLIRVFEADADRPLLRELLPFDNLNLLLLDSAPMLAIIAVCAVVAAALGSGSLGMRLAMAAMILALAVIAVLCRGLEHVTIAGMRSPVGFSLTGTLSIAAVLYAGSSGSPVLACGTAAFVVIGLAGVFWGSSEYTVADR